MDPFDLSPRQFEEDVRRLLDEESVGLSEFRSSHLEMIKGTDGDYVFDVTARFSALGANFIVLVECKRQKKPIERAVVELLYDKLRAVGVQKGMIFSTARFQSGAIKFAQTHGIALVLIEDGRTCYKVKGYGGTIQFPPWIPRTTGLLVTLTEEGNEYHSRLGAIGPPEWNPKSNGYLSEYLRA